MTTPLTDHEERFRALGDHGATLLIEAGAGTGKTALMAGRLVRVLADGRPPDSIAALTFTELAASELQQRVAHCVERILESDVPDELAAGFPKGPSAGQLETLKAARRHLDQLTCTTIHGFCKQLIGPYPVETTMDPGAKIIDPAEAALTYDELLQRWLREHLSRTDDCGAENDLLAQMLLQDPDHAITKIKEVAGKLRRNRTAKAPPADLSRADLVDFEAAVDAFADTVAAAGAPDSDAIAADLAHLRERLAAALDRGPDARGLVECAEPPRIPAMKSDTTAFRNWNKKGVFVKAARARGASKAEAERLNDVVKEAYEHANAALDAFLRKAVGTLNARFLEALAALLDRYAAHKRDAALLDFDDLLFAARDLLRDHPEVRDALAERYKVILVDEFQDTDPLQADILWRLSESTPRKSADAPWTERIPEPGKLFLVGDPKQSIYRFRGADVGAYLAARDALDVGAGERLSIRANFRSCSGLLDWVNASFDGPLSAENQPGFEALAATRHDAGRESRVAALELAVESSNPEKAPTVDDIRRTEAVAVADLCRRLDGNYEVFDSDVEGGMRACRPGDIALIAPVGTSLWIYESALEAVDLPIATQAGKGAFRRQEILDLIALTRVLADGRDTLALGALLRGPLIGLTEEQLLDCVQALPRDPERPDRIPALNLNVNPDALPNTVAAHALQVLRGLRARARRVTPFELIAEAVEELRVRPILEQRHPRSAERALSNVDLFLELARPYAVRGLKAFAQDMRRKWEDSAGQSEGRPDAQQQAVQVITMHSAKGLEWPVVIPVNAMGEPMREYGPQLRRSDGTLHLHLTKTAPRTEAYDAAKQLNENEAMAERVRLWYVTCTRAEQLLVFPRPDAELSPRAWIKLAGLDLAALPAFDIEAHPPALPEIPVPERNRQDHATFVDEARRVREAHPTIRRRSPSRHENGGDPAVPVVFAEGDVPPVAAPRVLGSTTRGLVLHKLLEELLTGELSESDLESRADVLLRQLGAEPQADPSVGPCAAEIANTTERALRIPDVAEVRDRLVPECPVTGVVPGKTGEEIVSGVADAVAPDETGAIEAVIDWKSDIAAEPAQRERYRQQMRDYLHVTGARSGILVYATEGTADRVLAE